MASSELKESIAKTSYIKLIFEDGAIGRKEDLEKKAKLAIQIAEVFVEVYEDGKQSTQIPSNAFIKATNGDFNK